MSNSASRHLAINTSAPGKMLLIGEYAVLDGAPAVVIAVDRRASVTLKPTSKAFRLFDSAGQCPECQFTLTDGYEVKWASDVSSESIAHYGLMASLVSALSKHYEIPFFSAELDTRTFYFEALDSRQKLGIGSSAALGVAFLNAMMQLKDTSVQPRLPLDESIALYREIQQGQGSGADVAASTLGGVVDFRLKTASHAFANRLDDLPSNIALIPVWTGKSASTTQMLRQLKQWRSAKDQNEAIYQKQINVLSQISQYGVQSIEQNDALSFLDALSQYQKTLSRLGQTASLPIMSLEHQSLVELAKAAEVVYKPSGAGGGDLGFAASDNPEKLSFFAKKVEQSGFYPLSLQIDACGAQINIER